MIHLGPRACRELLGEQRFSLSNRDGGWDLDLVVGNSIQQLSFFERLASGSPEQRTGASNPSTASTWALTRRQRSQIGTATGT